MSKMLCISCGKPERFDRYARCRDCYREHRAAWLASRAEQINAKRRRVYRETGRGDVIRERQRRYYHENRSSCMARAKEWRQRNSERTRAYSKSYRQSDSPGAIRMRLMSAVYSAKSRAKRGSAYLLSQREYERRRRAAKGGQIVDYAAIEAASDGLCEICGYPVAKPEFDHVTPLKRGGKHCATNIRVTHAHCNRAKNHRLDDEIHPRIVLRARSKSATMRPPWWPDDLPLTPPE